MWNCNGAGLECDICRNEYCNRWWECDACGREYNEAETVYEAGGKTYCEDCITESIDASGARYIIENCLQEFVEQYLNCSFKEFAPPQWLIDDILDDYDAVYDWCIEDLTNYMEWAENE